FPRSHGLSESAILSAWEDAATADRVERPLLLLRRAAGGRGNAEELDSWPIGQRDASLIEMHRATFGSKIAGTTPCPVCGEVLEMRFDLDEVRAGYGSADTRLEIVVEEAGELAFRLPTTADLRMV